MKRILLAALLGGLIIFLWGWVYHMALPFAGNSFSQLPNEEIVLDALSENIPEEGMYYYPWMDMGGHTSDADEAEWNEKHRTGPVGILLFKPVGGEPMPPVLMVGELLSNIFTALLLAFIAASLHGTWMKRSLLLSLVGLFAWGAISFSSWNWFGYPLIHMIGQGVEVFIGAFFAALLVAKLVPPPSDRTVQS